GRRLHRADPGRHDHRGPRRREAEAHRLARHGERRDRSDEVERGTRGEAPRGAGPALRGLSAGDHAEGGGRTPRRRLGRAQRGPGCDKRERLLNGLVPSSPLAGRPAPPSILVDVAKLVTAYYTGRPDPSVPAQRVSFGTSGHRGSSFDDAFNEAHILAM